jgi:LPLT family lysophospholipid transporter-like MFS transporter
MNSRKNYPLLLVSQFLGAFGDNAILAVILGQLLNLSKHGELSDSEFRSRSVFYTSLLFVPYVLLAPLAGYFNDRYPKTLGLKLGNLLKLVGTVVCALSIPFGFSWQTPGYLIVGVGSCLYGPAKYGILPEILPVERLVKANGTVELLTLVAIITGGVGGASLVDNFPLTTCYAVLLAIYALALVLNAAMTTTPSDARIQLGQTLAEFFGHLKSLLAGPRLGKILIGTTLFWVCGSGLKNNFQAWGKQVLSLPNNLQVSLLGLWLSVGIMVGSVLAGVWYRVGDLQSTRRYGMGLVGSLLLLWSVEPVFFWRQLTVTVGGMNFYPGVVGLLIVTGFVAGLFLIPLNAALQAESDPEKLGKTIAVQNFCENIGMLLAGGLVAACVKLGISPGGVFAALAGIVLIVVLWLRIPGIVPRTTTSIRR